MPLYDSVNGVARKVDKIYDGVNGIARLVTKAYEGVDGVAREYYSSASVWSKYNCTEVIGHYEEIPVPDNPEAERQGVIFRIGGDYNYPAPSEVRFLESAGFYSNGEPLHFDTIPETVEQANSIFNGRYYIKSATEVCEVEVIEISYSDKSSGECVLLLEFTPVRQAEYVSPTYEKGDYISQVETPTDTIPQDGNIVIGSFEEGYCVLSVITTDPDGDAQTVYYYYVLEE